MVLEAWPPKGDGAVLLGGPSVEADGADFGADFGTSLPGEPSDARQSSGCAGQSCCCLSARSWAASVLRETA